jgi:hypothetical protein
MADKPRAPQATVSFIGWLDRRESQQIVLRLTWSVDAFE